MSFPALKRKKSEVSVLSLSVEDPSCHDGMIRVTEKLIPYLPRLPTGSNQKTVLFGDQLYIERGRTLVFLWNLIQLIHQTALTYCHIFVGSISTVHFTGHSVSWGRCGEKDPVSKLDGVIFIPQEWHKKQVWSKCTVTNQDFGNSDLKIELFLTEF